jgi:sugar phosphate permease
MSKVVPALRMLFACSLRQADSLVPWLTASLAAWLSRSALTTWIGRHPLARRVGGEIAAVVDALDAEAVELADLLTQYFFAHPCEKVEIEDMSVAPQEVLSPSYATALPLTV